MKKRDKVFSILIAVALLLVGFSVYVLFSFTTKSTDDISYYMALCEETDGETCLPILGSRQEIDCPYSLPKQDYLDLCTDYRFDYTAKRVSVFESHAYTLICKFSDDLYTKEKANLDNKYEYLKTDTPGLQVYLKTEFELNGFSFSTIKGGDYPKDMLFVGFSDSTNEIAYIYYHDMDLDSVSPSITDFIKKETGWNNIIS